MNYLKKFITANIFSLCGYLIFGYVTYYIMSVSHDSILIWGGIATEFARSLLHLEYVFYAFLIEFIINFTFSKILKKNIGLNFNNNKYDFLFRLGLLLLFTPAILIMGFIFILALSVIFPFIDQMWIYNPSDIILLLFYICTFYLLTKYVFFRKK